MLLYRGQSYSEILLCLIYRSLRNLEQFPLCDWKLCEFKPRKHRIWQLNCLFNNYNNVIPRQMVIRNIFMLNIQKPAQFGTIPTLRLEAMRV